MNTCPSHDQLALHLDGALDAAEAARLVAHLDTCRDCALRFAALEALDEAVATPEPLPSGFLDRLLGIPAGVPADVPGDVPGDVPADVPGAVRAALAHGRWRRPLQVALAAAAVLLVALLLRGRAREEAPDTRDDVAVVPTVPAPTVPAPTLPAPTLPAPTLPTPAQPTPARPTPIPPAPIPPDPSRMEEGDLLALHRLARGDDTELARAALRRLGEFGRRESLPVLKEVAGRADRSREAAAALGALGDERAVPVLEALLTEEATAAAALAAIEEIGGGAAARALARTLERTEDVDSARRLIDVLGRVDGATGAREILLLLDHTEAARSEAARDALRRHEARLLPHLLAYASGRHGPTAERALSALEILAPPAAVPTLDRLLDSRLRRAQAAQVLARIDTPQAAAALWRGLPAPDVRLAFRRGGLGAETWLLERLRLSDHRARLRVIDLLGLCGGERSVPVLAMLAEQPALAPHVVLALGRIGGTDSVRVLARLAERPALRRGAIAALGTTGTAEAAAALERLAVADRTLRGAARRALASIPSPRAVEAIVRLGGDLRGLRETERALRAMDREVVLAALQNLLDGDLAHEARRALDAIGTPAGGRSGRVVLR